MPSRRSKSKRAPATGSVKKRENTLESRTPKVNGGKKKTTASSPKQPKNTRHFDIPLFVGFTTMFGYAILTIFGHIRDFFGRLLKSGRYFGKEVRSDVAPLVESGENFYDRRMYHRIQDVFNRPITGPPGANGMKILERKSTDSNFSFKQTGYVKYIRIRPSLVGSTC
eukprot:g4070.t1